MFADIFYCQCYYCTVPHNIKTLMNLEKNSLNPYSVCAISQQ